MAKSDAANAERAAEHYCREVLNCVRTCWAVRTQYQRQDLFSSDCIGLRDDGVKLFVQVTSSVQGASGNVATRRRKMEQVPWHVTDIVLLLEMRRNKNGRVVTYYFREHRLRHGRWMIEAIEYIPKGWFRAWKK